jgi:hypothetical protein
MDIVYKGYNFGMRSIHGEKNIRFHASFVKFRRFAFLTVDGLAPIFRLIGLRMFVIGGRKTINSRRMALKIDLLALLIWWWTMAK